MTDRETRFTPRVICDECKKKVAGIRQHIRKHHCYNNAEAIREMHQWPYLYTLLGQMVRCIAQAVHEDEMERMRNGRYARKGK